MRELDRRTIEELGVPGLALMEVAGRCVADVVSARHPQAQTLLALVGPGNNGADAVVAARLLVPKFKRVQLLTTGPAEQWSPDLAHQMGVAERLGLPRIEGTQPGDALSQADVVVDGLFGTGLSRAIEGELAQLVCAVNQSRASVVSVDGPSGICGATGQILGAAIRAETTVTFQFSKQGHWLFPGRDHVGELRVCDIGIPESFLADAGGCQILDRGWLHRVGARILPPRAKDTHKGTYGHLFVVAGHPERPGAAVLAARAGLAAGSGLVSLGSDRETIVELAPGLCELMGRVVIDAHRQLKLPRLKSEAEAASAFVFGPSLEPTPELAKVLLQWLGAEDRPAVLDAGALTAFGSAPDKLVKRQGTLVLTPHPKEAARLLGCETAAVQSDRPKAAQTLAEKSQAVVILKGASTWIAGPDGRQAVCPLGHGGMASGGMGDVLSGMVGSLLGQGLSAFDAACLAATLHAEAGERLGQRPLRASEVIDAVPRVLESMWAGDR